MSWMNGKKGPPQPIGVVGMFVEIGDWIENSVYIIPSPMHPPACNSERYTPFGIWQIEAFGAIRQATTLDESGGSDKGSLEKQENRPCNIMYLWLAYWLLHWVCLRRM